MIKRNGGTAMYVTDNDSIDREEIVSALKREAEDLEQNAKIRDAQKVVSTEQLDNYLLKRPEVDLVLRNARLLDTRELNDTDYYFIVEIASVNRSEVHDGGDGNSPNHFRLYLYVGDEKLQERDPDNPNVFSKVFSTRPIMMSRVEDQKHAYLADALAVEMKRYTESIKDSTDVKDKICEKFIGRYMEAVCKDILQEAKCFSFLHKPNEDFAFLCNNAKEVDLQHKILFGLDFKKMKQELLNDDVTINISNSELKWCSLLKNADNISIDDDTCVKHNSNYVNTGGLKKAVNKTLNRTFLNER